MRVWIREDPQRRAVRRLVRRTWKIRLPTPVTSPQAIDRTRNEAPLWRVDSGRVAPGNGEQQKPRPRLHKSRGARCSPQGRYRAKWTRTAPLRRCKIKSPRHPRSGGDPPGPVRTVVGKTARRSPELRAAEVEALVSTPLCPRPNLGSWMQPTQMHPSPTGIVVEASCASALRGEISDWSPLAARTLRWFVPREGENAGFYGGAPLSKW